MEAANRAISSPLLEDASVKGARGVIINVTGGADLSLIEVSEASAIIQEAAHEDANIIFGAVVDPKHAGQGEDHRHRDRLRSSVAAIKQATGVGRGDAGRSAVLHGVPGDREDRGVGRRRLAASGVPAPGAGDADSRRPPPDPANDTFSPGAEFEPVSPLDVPAFLRRQNE